MVARGENMRRIPKPRPTYAALVAEALASVRAAVKQLRKMEKKRKKPAR